MMSSRITVCSTKVVTQLEMQSYPTKVVTFDRCYVWTTGRIVFRLVDKWSRIRACSTKVVTQLEMSSYSVKVVTKFYVEFTLSTWITV